MDNKRIVIFPHCPKWAVDAWRAHAFRILLCLNADIQRVFDPGTMDVDSFYAYLSRIPEIRRSCEQGTPPLIMLTETFPFVSYVMRTRRTLLEWSPELSKAGWLIWYEPLRDPAFRSAAERVGSIEEGVDLDDFPILTTTEDAWRFMICTPSSLDMMRAERQFRRMSSPILPRKPSGQMPMP